MVSIYARFVARYPGVVAASTFTVCFVVTLTTVLVTESPDFSDPIKGFETRGTEISQRSLALYNLRLDLTRNARRKPIFYRFPDEFALANNYSVAAKNVQMQTSRTPNDPPPNPDDDDDEDPRQNAKHSKGKKGRKGKNRNNKFKYNVDPKKPPAFCNTEPGQCSSGLEYGVLIFETVGGADLFSLEVMNELCMMEQKLYAGSAADGIALPWSECQPANKRRCCQPWHLASVAAHLVSKSDCRDLNSSDVERLRHVVTNCSADAQKMIDCWNVGNCDCFNETYLPRRCVGHSLSLLYKYILPEGYAQSVDDSSAQLTAMVLPMAKTAFADITVEAVEGLSSFLTGQHVRLVAADLGLRDVMFEQYLLGDRPFGLLALVLVFVCMWIYSGDAFFTVTVVVGIVLSLGLAYFTYRLVFQIEFFPFMNLLTVVLIIGVGADDAFIFHSAWVKAKYDKNSGTMAKIVSDTLSNAAVSMLVTSLTTAAAFYANIFSDIVVVKCFGLFAGTTILANYLMVISWLPACVVCNEKWPIFSLSHWVIWCGQLCNRVRPRSRIGSDDRRFSATLIETLASQARSSITIISRSDEVTSGSASRRDHKSGSVSSERRPTDGWNVKKLWAVFYNPAHRRYQELSDVGRIFFQKLLPWLVIKLRLLWLLVMGASAVAAAVAVFYSPTLKLPSREIIQYFKRSHPFERWELELKQRFHFSAESVDKTKMPLMMYVVWGVLPTGNAKLYDPEDTGVLQPWPNGKLDLSDNVLLLWIREFCVSMAKQNFTNFDPLEMSMAVSCFVYQFMSTMSQKPCLDAGTKKPQEPCCSSTLFPYPRGVFQTCLTEFMGHHRTDISSFDITSGIGPSGPFFSADTSEPAGLVVMFKSSFNVSVSYSDMHQFYRTVEPWVAERLRSGPEAVRDGWLTSDHLHFYDLQYALTSGTRLSVLVAVVIAFLVLFLATFNPLISFLAILSIASIIVVTIAVLILLDWELNVLESTIIILTIGLSFDFTLHYGVAYRLCPAVDDRESRVVYALAEVGSAVFMAFVTTSVAGAAMLPSTTLAYFQIGLFMILVTSISWLYATFFFCSLLYCFGPSGQRCQFDCQRWQRSSPNLFTSKDKHMDGETPLHMVAAANAARRKKSSVVAFNAVVNSATRLNSTSSDYQRLQARPPSVQDDPNSSSSLHQQQLPPERPSGLVKKPSLKQRAVDSLRNRLSLRKKGGIALLNVAQSPREEQFEEALEQQAEAPDQDLPFIDSDTMSRTDSDVATTL